MDLLGKKSQLPAAELSDDEMDALSGLTKINPTGKQGSFNPYKTINPEFLTTALDQDDDDWMYMGEDNKPRERTGHIFNMVGSGGLVGGAFGVLSATRILHNRSFLTLKSLRHPIKRSESITAVVSNCRDWSAKAGTFAFVTSLGWAFLDKQIPVDPKFGSAFGGAVFGLSPFWHKDMNRTRQSLLKQEQEWLRNNNNKGPRFWQLNQLLENKILNRYRAEGSTVPKSLNFMTGMGRVGFFATAAYGITYAMEQASNSKGFIRDVKRWKW